MPKATLSLLILPALIAAGCPVYDDGCYSDSDWPGRETSTRGK
jgi:hypothetical protein